MHIEPAEIIFTAIGFLLVTGLSVISFFAKKSYDKLFDMEETLNDAVLAIGIGKTKTDAIEKRIDKIEAKL